jgi:acylphosphatase
MNTDPDAKIRLHMQVKGRVQNVGFRAFVLQAGASLGLTGWVRNLDYDHVETIAEGPRSVLERFALLVKAGPRAARVDEAREEWEKATGEFASFTVRSSR